jgi:hypothetical protein
MENTMVRIAGIASRHVGGADGGGGGDVGVEETGRGKSEVSSAGVRDRATSLGQIVFGERRVACVRIFWARRAVLVVLLGGEEPVGGVGDVDDWGGVVERICVEVWA